MTRAGLRTALVAVLLAAGCHWLRGPDEAWIAAELHQRTGQVVEGSPLPNEPFIPTTVNCDDGLTEEECVALAVCNNSAYLELLGDMGLARADLITAGMISNPQLTFLVPSGAGKQLEAAVQMPLDFLLRPWRVGASRADATRVAERLIQGGLDLVRDVRAAFADMLLAKDRVRYADQVARLRDRIDQLAAARLKAGEASLLEAQTAHIDALRGREEAARLVYDVTVAENRLRTLIGFAQVDCPWHVVEADRLPDLCVDLDAVVQEAINWRPDVRAPLWTAEAARLRVKLACLGQFGLNVLGDINALGEDPAPFQIGPGVQFHLPIFNQNQGRIAAARAEIEKALRAHAAARDRAALEVRQANALYEQAKTDLARWQQQIRPAVEEAERRALKSYEAGDASLLLTLEATRQVVDTLVREAQLRGDVRRTWAELERSVGRRIVPPAQPEPPPPPLKPARLENQAPGDQHGSIDFTFHPDQLMTPIPIRVGRRPAP